MHDNRTLTRASLNRLAFEYDPEIDYSSHVLIMTALQQALTAPKTTLTEFFCLCNRQDVVGQFAKTLMYTDVPKFFTWNKQKGGNHGSKTFQSQDSRTYL